MRAFHAYANWLVSISWKRFFLLSLLLLISAGVLQNIAAVQLDDLRDGRDQAPREVVIPTPPKPPTPPSAPVRADGKEPASR